MNFSKYYIYILPLIYFVISISLNAFSNFGIFIDEFYYITGTKHLSLGYVDHPPLSIYLLKLFSFTGYPKLFLRAYSALLGSITIYLTSLLAHRLKLSTLSVFLSGLAVFFSPVFNIIFGFYSMNAWEPIWILCIVHFLLSYRVTENSNYWIYIFLFISIAYLNKHTSIVYSLLLILPYVLSKKNSVLVLKNFWLGVLISFIIISPNLYWMWNFNFVNLEFYVEATRQKNIFTPFHKILLDQILSQNPGTVLLWIPGFIYFAKERKYRNYFYSLSILFILFLFSGSSRPDRLASIYPVLFVGGSAILSNKLKYLSLTIITLAGFILSPVFLPILSPKDTTNYSEVLGIVPKIEQQKQSPLPQWFADRTDWDIFIEETFLAINTLPEEDRNPSIYVNDYGHAGAINYYLPQFKVLSGHNQFYFWGKKAKPNSIVVYGENNYKFFEPYFKESKFIGSYSREYSNEFSVPIYFLKGAKVPMYKYWERLKNFN